MEKKIIELTDIQYDEYNCIICCKRKATTKVKICRIADGDSISAFHVCNNCLSIMQKDIENRK